MMLSYQGGEIAGTLCN